METYPKDTRTRSNIRKPQFLVILFAGINSILSIAYQKKKNLRSFAKQNTPYRARPI